MEIDDVGKGKKRGKLQLRVDIPELRRFVKAKNKLSR